MSHPNGPEAASWSGRLPEEVRRDVIALAASVLGAVPEPDVPVTLRRVRGFTPARRASAGAVPLMAALEKDTFFRHRVAQAWREAHPDVAAALDEGEPAPAVEPALLVAGAYLLRPPGWEQVREQALLTLAEQRQLQDRQEAENAVAAQVDAARAVAARLEGDLDQVRRERAELEEEISRLRREARKLRADADRARAAQRTAEALVADLRAGMDQERALGQARLERLQARVQEAERELTIVRKSHREGRSLAAARTRLLLDTVVDAAAGLRRELALPPLTVSPADVVVGLTGDIAPDGAPDVPLRAYEIDDPAVLDQLLALPRAHLVVDGYNVTKSAYGGLPLAEQRRRLVDGLVTLCARTGAEVTCCFDGADVESRGALKVRGVRVLFSDAGTTADELIRRLVRAEPQGRVVVVVSTDGEVASGVRASGARAVPSSALARLLART